MLTSREAFKAAFLYKCASDGLMLDETHDRVKEALAALSARKQAGIAEWIPGYDMVAKTYQAGLDLAKDTLIPKLVSTGLLGGLLIPPAVGAAAGYGAAKLHGINDENIEESKDREKIDAYRHAAEATRLKTRLARHRAQTRRPRGLIV